MQNENIGDLSEFLFRIIKKWLEITHFLDLTTLIWALDLIIMCQHWLSSCNNRSHKCNVQTAEETVWGREGRPWIMSHTLLIKFEKAYFKFLSYLSRKISGHISFSWAVTSSEILFRLIIGRRPCTGEAPKRRNHRRSALALSVHIIISLFVFNILCLTFM